VKISKQFLGTTSAKKNTQITGLNCINTIGTKDYRDRFCETYCYLNKCFTGQKIVELCLLVRGLLYYIIYVSVGVSFIAISLGVQMLC